MRAKENDLRNRKRMIFDDGRLDAAYAQFGGLSCRERVEAPRMQGWERGLHLLMRTYRMVRCNIIYAF